MNTPSRPTRISTINDSFKNHAKAVGTLNPNAIHRTKVIKSRHFYDVVKTTETQQYIIVIAIDILNEQNDEEDDFGVNCFGKHCNTSNCLSCVESFNALKTYIAFRRTGSNAE